jgi:hypothetical protein
VPPWGVVDDHALEDTATCQRLLLVLLPEGKPSIELAESLAKDFNCSYDIRSVASTSEVRHALPPG